MLSFTGFVVTMTMLSVARGHAFITNAQGLPNSPPSVGFLVQPNLPRNCSAINPCQQDTTIIRDAEIKDNLVNECGRTQLAGNIDIGQETEIALQAKQVTRVKAGGEVQVTMHVVNADGGGPFTCDMDLTSNSNGLTGQVPLNVTQNVPGANGFELVKAQAFNMTVKLPAKMACVGASTGNICTIRCRNNAVAGPFGSCFAVMQDDVKPKVNTPQNIPTKQALPAALSQTEQNKADLNAAVNAIAVSGSEASLKNDAAVKELLGPTAPFRRARGLRNALRSARRYVVAGVGFEDDVQ